MVFVKRLTLGAAHFAVSVNISHLVIIQNALGQKNEHWRLKQQRRNRQNNNIGKRRSRTRPTREENTPRRPRPTRKRDNRTRTRKSNPHLNHLQCPLSEQESTRGCAKDSGRKPLCPTKQSRPCGSRS